MLGYILQRSLLMVPTLVGITVISFFIMHLAPGDPVDLFLGGVAGGEGLASDRQQDIEKTREELRRQLGLDRPVHVQYFNWVTALFLKVETISAFDRSALRPTGCWNGSSRRNAVRWRNWTGRIRKIGSSSLCANTRQGKRANWNDPRSGKGGPSAPRATTPTGARGSNS